MSRSLREVLIVTAIGFGVYVGLMAILVTTALPHSFYPVECCSGFDCAAIDEKRVSPAVGGYMVDSIHFVPQSEVRQSPDGEFHACFPTPQKLRCFWAPPQGS